MVEVEVNDTIEAPVEKVWAGIRDFGDLSWSGLNVKVEGEGVGAVRTIRVRGGFSVQERLETFDEADHRFSYSIVEPTLVPVRDYLAQVELSADGDHTKIRWSGRFEPNGVSGDQAARIMQEVFENGVRGMKRTFAQG